MPTGSLSIPAPVGGWNARDPIAVMSPEDAIRLENAIPQNDKIELRKGYAVHTSSGMGSGVVETLAEYVNTAGTNFLIGFANNKIFNCSSSGAATDITGTTTPTTNRWYTFNMNGVIVMLNGVETPQSWAGSSTAADISITGSGLTSSNLITGTVYKGRAYYVETGTASIWYAGAGAHSGATTELDLSSILKKGGNIQFVTAWTRDSGEGVDELFIAVSSEGEVIVYSGDNPGDAAWTITGRFFMPRPLSRRSFVDMGPDVIVITLEGAIPLSSVLSQSGLTDGYPKLSDKINGAFTQATRGAGTNFGWDIIHYPRAHLVLINHPKTESITSEQFVLNTQNGAWCKFTGVNAVSWVVFNDKPYFGGTDGKVYEFDTGDDDNGNNIEFRVQTAYNYMEDRTKIKHFKLGRPNMISDNSLNYLFDVDVDFQGRKITQSIQTVGSAGSVWDTATWDTATWDTTGLTVADWRVVAGLGRSASVMIEGDFKNVSFSLSSIDMIYESGGVL